MMCFTRNTVVLLAMVLLIGMASAVSAEPTGHWRVNVLASSEALTHSGSATTIGQWDSAASSVWSAPPTFGELAWVGAQVDNDLYNQVINPSNPTLGESWRIRVLAGNNYAFDVIQLRLQTLGHPVVLPQKEFDVPIWFQLTMVDNQGVAGAPANGMSWFADVPHTVSTDFYFDGLSLLPAIRAPGSVTASDLMTIGYEFELAVVPVPEPGSMLALGSGIIGLAGVIARRRRF